MRGMSPAWSCKQKKYASGSRNERYDLNKFGANQGTSRLRSSTTADGTIERDQEGAIKDLSHKGAI